MFFGPLQITGITVNCVCILVSIFNVTLTSEEVFAHGIKHHIGSLLHMVFYLISMCALTVTSFVTEEVAYHTSADKTPLLILRIGYSLFYFFFVLAVAGITLTTLQRFDTVIPRTPSRFHVWRMRLLYSFHATVSLAALVCNTYGSAMLTYTIGEHSMLIWSNAIFLVWWFMIEFSVSYILLNSLLGNRIDMIKSVLNSSAVTVLNNPRPSNVNIIPREKGKMSIDSSKYHHDVAMKQIRLNRLIFYLRICFMYNLVSMILYVVGFILLDSNTAGFNLVNYSGSLVIALYLTFFVYQKNVVAMIYQ